MERMKTVGSVGAVVNGLSVTADPTELFTTLKAGLQGPLVGMGTAFGSSLLGLAGSLVLGFLDLQMGQAQNRFFVDLENWLFASAGDRGAGDESSPLPAIQALVERTSDNIDRFRQVMSDAEEDRKQSAQAIRSLADSIAALTGAYERDRGDAAIRVHLQAIEAGITRIADEQSQTRAAALEDARNEIKRLARTIGIAADDHSGN